MLRKMFFTRKPIPFAGNEFAEEGVDYEFTTLMSKTPKAEDLHWIFSYQRCDF